LYERLADWEVLNFVKDFKTLNISKKCLLFYHIKGGVSLSGYLNDCNFDLAYENNNIKAKLLIDFGDKIFGIFDSASTGIPRPITADLHYDHLKAARIAIKLGDTDPQTYVLEIKAFKK